MRLSSMTAIAEGPAAPLSPRMRAELRADRPPAPAPFVRSESGRRLARALDRFARGDRDRAALLVHGPQGSGRTTVVLRAVEQAMVALTWLARPVQLLPVSLRAGSLWNTDNDRFDDVRVVARHLAVAALAEVVERLGARVGEDAERTAAVEALWQTLAGLPERDALRAMRKAAEPRFSLFGDGEADDDDGEDDERVGREAEVLWQAVRLRGVRAPVREAPPAPPAPIPAVDPAVVDALRDRIERLTAALAERDAALAAHIATIGQSRDPFAVVLAALSGAALGLAIAGGVATGLTALAAGGVVGAVVGGGLGFVLGRNGHAAAEPDLPRVPEFAPLPEPAVLPAPAPEPAPDDEPPAAGDSPTDVDGLLDLFGHFVRDLRAVGYAPVFIFDELDRADRATVEPRVARLLADLPDGCCAILVAGDGDFAANAPEIQERLPVFYVPAALHAYLDRRLTLPGDLSETAEADARIDKAILRYALLHASRMQIRGLERMLAERNLAGVRLDAQQPRAVYAFRLRAAQQIALERVLAERGATGNDDPAATRLLTRALQYPLLLWEAGDDPEITETTLADHLDGGRADGEWTTASAAERARIWSALSILLGLMSSRAGLVARLPDHLAPLADLIPDAPLVVRHGDGWRWAFDAQGNPTAAGLAGDAAEDEKPTRNLMPPKKAPANTEGSRFRSIDRAAMGLEAPKRLRPGDPLPVTGEFRAYSAALAATGGGRDLDDDADESLAGLRPGVRRPLIDAAEAARFLEAVDEALGTIGDGALSIGRLARVGLVPTIPTPAAIARALTEGDTPHARIVLDEAVGRIRERLGVIEKFSLWLTAARALATPGENGTLEIAAALVRARALRGRSAPAQHAHLVTRDLQAELRNLCPRLRLRSTVFRRQAAPGTDAEALAAWGEALRKKNEDLAESLREGTNRATLTSVAWRALRSRLRKLVTDGEAGLPAFAETIAALEGVAGATVTDWLSPVPTARNLSALLLAAREHSAPDQLGDGGLYAALALGLNRNGTDAAGLELPPVETSEAGDLIRETVRARPPIALVLTTDPTRGLAASRPPRRGSALVLTPDEVITSTRKLGFEVIFLDDPSIDAGLLPLPPAPVLAPPLADDIDAALGWWVTHR